MKVKKFISFKILLLLSFTSFAQVDPCDCPRPNAGKFVNICTLVENKDSNFKKQFWEMSCVNIKNDSKETIKEKVNCMWEKFYSEFGCDSTGFMVGQGNALKFSVSQEFEVFIESVVNNFGLNINLKDPADGKTLLDFTLDEINRYKGDTNYPDKAKELEEIYNQLKNDLNAKHSSELTPQDALPYRVKKTQITVSTDILKKYEGKYVNKDYKAIYIKLENEKLFYSFGDETKYFELSADSKTSFFRKPTPAFAKSEFTLKIDAATGKYDLILNYNHTNIVLKRGE